MSTTELVGELCARFGDAVLGEQITHEHFPTLWIRAEASVEVHRYLKDEIAQPFRMLVDLWAIDETARKHREGQPPSGITIASHLLSHDRNADIRIKTPLDAEYPRAKSITGVFPNAAWYEREAFDMFGVEFEARPHSQRILLPPGWEGHPMRKTQPGRATERPLFNMTATLFDAKEHALVADAERFGLPTHRDGVELMILNYGPHSMATHGVFRVVLALDGEEIVAARPDIGFHHRGAEKMAERQTWHNFLPYTDRVDYLGGVMGEMPYLQAVEKACGIRPPDRALMVRIMLSEMFRIMNHLLFYGTMAQDTGAMSPVFYMFTDRERGYRVIESITGARMHPGYFRIGGLSMDLPEGWDKIVREFLDWMPSRLDDYEGMVLRNEIFQARTKGVAAYDTAMAIDLGVSGP
ncbi:NADH-quinone oxidoreductase subunit C, partial [Rhodopseudomonas sp. B29]|uniref:NADH-quinone oxidoreductase subunit C n=1 Tax=Rhodopseudomonas sp. B29 TaxID=95607 RepID=UPI0003B46C24